MQVLEVDYMPVEYQNSGSSLAGIQGLDLFTSSFTQMYVARARARAGQGRCAVISVGLGTG